MSIEVLGIIPARGGSKGIPRKNLVVLNGKLLIQYTIDAAYGSRYITRLILSSDDEEIIHYARQQGVEVPFKRPRELASGATPMLLVIQHALSYLATAEAYIPDYVVLLQPTSPLRTSKHIDQAFEQLHNADADSVVSVVEVPHQFNPYSIMEWKGKYLVPYLRFDERYTLRQYKPKFYARNGPAICISTYQCIVQKNSLYGDRILPYLMSKEASIDIDDEIDLLCAAALLEKQKYL